MLNKTSPHAKGVGMQVVTKPRGAEPGGLIFSWGDQSPVLFLRSTSLGGVVGLALPLEG